jgi:hypothetical protein
VTSQLAKCPSSGQVSGTSDLPRIEIAIGGLNVIYPENKGTVLTVNIMLLFIIVSYVLVIIT